MNSPLLTRLARQPAGVYFALTIVTAGTLAALLPAQDATRAAGRPPDIASVVTDENQRVAFEGVIWQMRELAKILPLDQPWPTGQPALQAAFAKYQLDQHAPPRAIPMPARIARDVYLVGQSRIIGNLTYLIDCGDDGLALIDPTYVSEVEATIAQVKACGFAPERIRWVLNTHCHVDHAMADAEFRQRGAQIAAGSDDADAIEKGTRVTAYYIMQPAVGPKSNVAAARFPKCPVALRLSDGEELALGNKIFHVIHTPGHTPGSVCFLLQVDGKNLLFSGDTVLYDARLGWQGNPYADNPRYLASLEKLAGFKLEPRRPEPFQFHVLLPGHGAISLDQAQLDIGKALEHARWQMEHMRGIQSTPFATTLYREKIFGRPPTPAR
jgi:glyoxylase-like metal-dependent hydrolase (beta-lactamase superfamily II)